MSDADIYMKVLLLVDHVFGTVKYVSRYAIKVNVNLVRIVVSPTI